MIKRWLRNWLLGSSAPVDKPPQPQAGGFFNQDIGRANPGSLYEWGMKRTFQRHPEQMRAIDPDGTAMAMDSNDIASIKPGYSYDPQTMPELQFAWYAAIGAFIGYQACAMIAQHWLVDKACAVPARDAVRRGYEITVNDGTEMDTETLDAMRQLDKDMQISDQMVEFIRFGRVFGIRIAMFDIDYGDDEATKAALVAPFNIDGVRPGSYRGISQIDPYWVTPELSERASANPAARDFYVPTWWRVNGVRVHRSHLCIYIPYPVADVLKPTYLWGGPSVPQRIMERVYAAERTANEAPLLAMTKRTTTLAIENIEAAITDQAEFETKLSSWISRRDNQQIRVIGAGETVTETDTSLADLDDVIMTQYQLVAACADMPITKLLQTVPKGFNATGEYDESNYHEILQSLQNSDLSPFLERHHQLAMRSRIGPKFYGADPKSYPRTSVRWNELDAMTEEELANVNKVKSETDANYINAGVLDAEAVLDRLIRDPDSGYTGIEKPEDALGDGLGDPGELPDLNNIADMIAKAAMGGGGGGVPDAETQA